MPNMCPCSQRDVGFTPSSVLSQLCDPGGVMAFLGLKLLLYNGDLERNDKGTYLVELM